MRPLLAAVRLLATLAPMLVPALAAAQDAVPPAAGEAPWQEVITSQIEAFRSGDAPAAFSYAGASFQRTFPSAVAFLEAIVAWGYTPILESRSHAFGTYQRAGATEVLQVVTLVGPDQQLYEAIYDLALETPGWRVQGVVLSGPRGMGI